jgi:mycothiol system anti-sigma-R factor
MNCNEAVEKLWQYLDRELEGDKVIEIELHLQQCRGCFSRAEFERHLRLLLRRSCGCDQAPPELRARLTRLLRMF